MPTSPAARSRGFSTTSRARGQGGGRQAGVRDRRQLADLAAHERLDPRHRRVERVADHAVQHQHHEVGRGPPEAASHSGEHAARGPAVERRLRQRLDHARRRRRSDRRDCRGSAGRAVRPDVRRAGMAKNTYGTGCFLLQNTGEHPVASRNRLLDGGLASRRQDDVCARGQRLHRRRRGPVAARRARHHPAVVRRRAAGAIGPGQRRRISCRPSRARGAALGSYARGTIVGITRGTTAGISRGPPRASRSRSPICSKPCTTTPRSI